MKDMNLGPTLGLLGRSGLAVRPVCRATATRWKAATSVFPSSSQHRYSSSASNQVDPAVALSRPSWSVKSLLPDRQGAPGSDADRVTPKQLHHLLRLSALPLPTSPEEEAEMISVLESQLLFVRDIQGVDTRLVEPLRSIRDETDEGLQEATIGVEQLQQALSEELVFGRRRRPRRQRNLQKDDLREGDWDPLRTASQKSGRFFVVRGSKSKNQ